jgi:hypothetical protein
MSTATEASKVTSHVTDENSISASAARLWRDIKKARSRTSGSGWGSTEQVAARWEDLLHGHVGVRNAGSPRFVGDMNRVIEREVSLMRRSRINGARWALLKACNAEIFRRNPERCQYTPIRLEAIEQAYREQRHWDVSKAGMKSGSGRAA